MSNLTTSPQIGELAAALAKAQGEMTVAYNDGKNPHFRSTYATLASIHQAAVGPLARNGLAVVQAPGLVDGTVTLTTRLIHSSGQWMECQMAAASKNMGPQAIGSTVTYLRRGGLAAMVGVVSSDDVDDDGEGAEGRGQRRDVPNAPQARANPGNNPHRGRHHHPTWEAEAGRFKAFAFALCYPDEPMGTESEQEAAYQDLREFLRSFPGTEGMGSPSSWASPDRQALARDLLVSSPIGEAFAAWWATRLAKRQRKGGAA
jgi:hypothetical protein